MKSLNWTKLTPVINALDFLFIPLIAVAAARWLFENVIAHVLNWAVGGVVFTTSENSAYVWAFVLIGWYSFMPLAVISKRKRPEVVVELEDKDV